MSLPTVTQTWTMSFNNRSVFSSIARTVGDLMFSLAGVGGFLTTTMGYTCKGSCDGVTGAMDGVNRLSNGTKFTTRNNGAAGAQSWIVLVDGAGINWCFSFNSTADAIVRLAHSTGGNYVAAGTPTQQPTATDECFDGASSSWVNANNTTRPWDTVWHMWSTSDKKMFRVVTCTAAALAVTATTFTAIICGEKFTPSIVSPTTFTLATGGGTVGAVKSYYLGCDGNGGRIFAMTSTLGANYAAGNVSDLCRVNATVDINAQASVGGECPGGATGAVAGNAGQFSSNYPALQGGRGVLFFPANIGSRTTGADGKLGNKIDHWFVIGNSTSFPNFLDMYGDRQFWAICPGFVFVGDGVTNLVDR